MVVARLTGLAVLLIALEFLAAKTGRDFDLDVVLRVELARQRLYPRGLVQRRQSFVSIEFMYPRRHQAHAYLF